MGKCNITKSQTDRIYKGAPKVYKSVLAFRERCGYMNTHTHTHMLHMHSHAHAHADAHAHAHVPRAQIAHTKNGRRGRVTARAAGGGCKSRLPAVGCGPSLYRLAGRETRRRAAALAAWPA